MAWTSWGFDGTINEAQWAQMAGLLGNGYVAAGNGDCLVTAVGGARSVSVAAGTLYGDGVVSTNSAAETVAMTTPVNGQWYVIALRRTWATNTAALVAIAGATTTTTTPTAPPSSFPTLNTNVGVLTDQPIAWAWCNSANTTVVVYDIRLKAVKSLPPVVANANERDAKFMSPTQGLQVWRDDLGAVETYYGLYNSSTNPGGRDTAGWYVTNRVGGLIPIRPSTVTIASGTGTTNSLGMVTVSGATTVRLDGVFTSEYKNYRLVMVGNTSQSAYILSRYSAGGTPNGSTTYGGGMAYLNANGTIGQYNVGPSKSENVWCDTVVGDNVSVVADILQPQLAQATVNTFQSFGSGGSTQAHFWGGWKFGNLNQFDGIYLLQTAGTFTGTIQVFGYND